MPRVTTGSFCQTQFQCNSDVNAPAVFFVQPPASTSHAFAANRHRLVGHNLRPRAQTVLSRRLDRHAAIGRVATHGSHLADACRCVRRWECVRVHHHCGTRLAVMAGCGNRNDVCAQHGSSNADTDSSQRHNKSSKSHQVRTVWAGPCRTSF